MTTDRSVTLAGFDTLQGSFAASDFSGRVEGGYRLSYGGIGVTPYGALQVQALVVRGYAEFAAVGSSQFALSYGAQAYHDTRTELGFWFDTQDIATPLTASGMTLYSRIAWAHDFQTDGQSSAVFQSLPGAPAIVVDTTKPADDGALITAGFDYKFAPGWSFEARFDGEFSSTTSLFSGTGGLRYQWGCTYPVPNSCID